ncbi:SUMF1/EgtB/PvdO family nonheme iron enzyme [Hyphomonas sp.]|uniref:SUMF1/EgtB/PvdO family nonheme iron enzyme n=1 Tax=Hyphomonas sp. TaxID=87 RepID=UPI0039196785
MASIFLSYSRADRPKAQQIAEALQGEGFSVWWDKVLRAGQTYDEVTEGMLRDADVVIVLWSAVSVKSKWVRAEATLGQRTSVLVPAMIEDAERPIMFELTQSADLIGWDGDRSDPRWKEFVADVSRAAEQSAPPPEAEAAPSAPGQAPDMTMELTFWTSIKDSQDSADFEAYLKRYPDGHYSDLARNRIAAIARANAPKPAPPPPPPPPPSPPPQPAPVKAAAPPPRPAPAPERKPEKKKSSPIPMIAGGLAAIVLAGWVIANLLPSEDAASPDTAETVAEDPPATELAELAAQPVPEAEAPPTEVTPAAPEPEPPHSDTAPPEAPACAVCPETVSLPGGTFRMGSPGTEASREPIEGPVREVTLKPFSISRGEVTAAEWAACIADGGCNRHTPPGGDSAQLPVTMVSWRDAEAYASWLSKKTGQTWRLPTEAEWEYAARGGTSTAYWWGDRYDAALAPRDKLRASADLAQNPFGLTGMLGNAREWVQDCYVNGYTDAPTDGRAVTSGDCSRRVVRGGSFRNNAAEMRSASRARISLTTRDRQIGFRVVLEPE